MRSLTDQEQADFDLIDYFYERYVPWDLDKSELKSCQLIPYPPAYIDLVLECHSLAIKMVVAKLDKTTIEKVIDAYFYSEVRQHWQATTKEIPQRKKWWFCLVQIWLFVSGLNRLKDLPKQ